MHSFIIHHESELKQVVDHVISQLKAKDFVLINGDLGSGKTTLVQYFCEALGVKNIEEVRSPTFALCHVYDAPIPILHYDLYRLKTVEELEELHVEENVNEEAAITFIEWACLFENYWSKEECIKIEIAVLENATRQVKVYGREKN